MNKPGDIINVFMDGENGEVIESVITYQDNEKSCGYAKVNPKISRKATVLENVGNTLICAVEGLGGTKIRIKE